MDRIDGRKNNEIRKVKITPHFLKYSDGSVLIETGDTKVICAATVEEKVPPFLVGTGQGWITSEYSMLPASTKVRKVRESRRGKIEGRTHEIQRLIGRALRSIVDLKKLGERTIWVDCDIIQADGGTRTSSITGSYVAMMYALDKMQKKGLIDTIPVTDYVAAISVGIVDGQPLLDLCFLEDSNAKVDMNIVMTGNGEFIEIQGTGEKSPFTSSELLDLLDLGEKGVKEIIEVQKNALGAIANKIGMTDNA
ncbi:MAG: ribonuclease PH [Clostridia bacterium]|nr:ribonuclease PH [Clostridia bacterium]